MATRKPTDVEYRFKIDAYTPETMPMARLAEYMSQLATILGEPAAVHFRRLERGSTVLVQRIEQEAAPKVRARVASVRRGDAPAEALRAYRTVNRYLREDNGVGALRESRAVIIRFPGREEVEESFPPVKQYGSVDGVLVGVVGSDDTVHVRLLIDGKAVSGFVTNRSIGKDLAGLFDEPVRLHGRGSWLRDEEGKWCLQSFKVEGFEHLKSATLSEALAEIRSLPMNIDSDAYAELDITRHGPLRHPNGGH